MVHKFILITEIGFKLFFLLQRQLYVYSTEIFLVSYTNTLSSIILFCKSAIAIGMLVDRGILSYSDKVTTFWPEFGKFNKENVTIGDLVQHASGILYFDTPLSVDELSNYDTIAKRIENQKHKWNGKRRVAYTAVTYGFPIGEVMRRVDSKNRTLGEFIHQEIAQPLNIEFYLGILSEAELKRVEPFVQYPHFYALLNHLWKALLPASFATTSRDVALIHSFASDPFNVTRKTFLNAIQMTSLNEWNSVPFQTVQVGASNGYSNAKSLATIAALMANKGTFAGKRLLNESTVEIMLTPIGLEYDHVLNYNLTRTIGGFGAFKLPITGDSLHYGWNGLGGSRVQWNTDYKIGYSYVMSAAEFGLTGQRATELQTQVFKAVIKKKQ